MTDTERLATILVAWLEGDQATRDRALADARAALAAIRNGEPIPEPSSLVMRDDPHQIERNESDMADLRGDVEAARARQAIRDANRLVREALDRQRGQSDDPSGTDPSFASASSGFASTVRKPVE